MRKINPGYAIALVILLCLAGCADLSRRVRLVDDNTLVPQRKAVIFFVDGVNHDVYQNLLIRNQLPNIDKYLVDAGCSVKYAFTAVPSITYAITATFATGQVPGRHGVLGNRFFDRDRLIFVDHNTIETYKDIDLHYAAANIYEILGDKFSVTIQTPLGRGAYHRIDNWAESGTCWFLHLFESVDRWTARRFDLIGQIARRAKRWPSLIFAYFPATDEIGHRCGPCSKRYRDSLINIDNQIGRICAALDHNNILESTFLILISDHGMANCQKENNVNLKKLLKENFPLRIATKGPDQRKSFSRRTGYFNRYQAVLVHDDGRYAKLYLKNGSDWSELPDQQQIGPVADFLVDHPGIGLVAYRRDPGVIVQTAAGRVLFERLENSAEPLNQKQYRYHLIDGRDPLGYDAPGKAGDFQADENYHSGYDWLKATASTNYPDLPVQIVEMFDSRRAGDLAIFAADGWDFNPRQLGGHGSVCSVDMRVPMVFAGPGIKPGSTIDMARTVDVAPTVIDMIDGSRLIGHRFDGRSLLPLMKKE